MHKATLPGELLCGCWISNDRPRILWVFLFIFIFVYICIYKYIPCTPFTSSQYFYSLRPNHLYGARHYITGASRTATSAEEVTISGTSLCHGLRFREGALSNSPLRVPLFACRIVSIIMHNWSRPPVVCTCIQGDETGRMGGRSQPAGSLPLPRSGVARRGLSSSESSPSFFFPLLLACSVGPATPARDLTCPEEARDDRPARAYKGDP